MHGVEDPSNQQRFVNAEGCHFRSLFCDENKWHFVKLEKRAGSDPEEVDEEREVVLRHVTTSVARSIKIENVGAHAFDKGKGERGKEECCLVEFASLPWTDQKGDKCALKVNCLWLNSVHRVKHWYTKSTDKTTVNVVHLVTTDLQMHPISPTNMVRNHQVRKEAERLGALRLSNDMISSWMRLKEKRDLHLILVECLLKMKSPLEVKRRTKKIKLKNSESESKNCCV